MVKKYFRQVLPGIAVIAGKPPTVNILPCFSTVEIVSVLRLHGVSYWFYFSYE